MKSLALAGPLALWLILAAPFYCHHGLTTAWSTSGHVHHASLLEIDVASPMIPDNHDLTSRSNLCRHHDPAADALAYTSVDSVAVSLYSFVIPDRPPGKLDAPSLPAPHGRSLSPLERPPSVTA